MKPYFEQDGITIYHGDCLEVMDGLGARFDLVFTSPPYNLSGVARKAGARRKWNGLIGGYGAYSDDMDQGDYEEWQRWCLKAMWDRLTPSGAIFYNHKPLVKKTEV